MVQDNLLRQRAFVLRLKGKSYGEIKRVLNIPKSTLSSWFKNCPLPSAAKKLLEQKRLAPRKQLMEFNRRRTQIIQAENKKILQAATNEIRKLSKYELLLLGAALYWAEGYKKQDKNRSPRVNIANSDPALISIFLRFLREIIKVPEERFKVSVRIYPNINPKLAINFWSKTTKIPQNRFHVTTQISRASRGKRPQNSLPYGTLDLRVNSRQNFYQIKGWIDELIKQSIR